MRRLAWLSVLVSMLFVLTWPSLALGYNENSHVSGGGCGGDCHALPITEADCGACHQFTDGHFPLTGEYSQSGPHGGYATTTDRCALCHTLHDAPASLSLLPGETIKATCLTCHDGTQGYGVYGAIQARTGAPAAGGHGIESTNVIPGGDAAGGGSSTGTAFRGPGGTLTCSDCHSPHDSNTVQAFTGERVRIRANEGAIYSTKLLKQQPTGAATSTAVYGSDWCAGCHQGRTSSGAVHNHPAETKASRPADFYYYNYLAVYRTSGFPTDGQYESNLPVPLTNANARIGAVGTILAAGNGGHTITTSPNWYEADFHSSPWLMTYPRSPLHAGHAPICQQCHEDTRNCGTLSTDGATANIIRDGVWGTDADGLNLSTYVNNPRFQNFPHETQNTNMLVETGDDLCLNCHPMSQLP